MNVEKASWVALLWAQTTRNGVSDKWNPWPGAMAEAAALAVAEFRRCGFADVVVGTGTSLAVTVQQPTTTHTVRMSRLEAWLNPAGKSPGEQALKIRLKGVLELAL